MLRQKLRPTLVLVGFSMATDLYDLVPPDRGGFVYGGDAARRYFDLDTSGELIEKLHDGSAVNALQPAKPDVAQSLRGFLEQFALYRIAKRSSLAMTVAAYWRPGGKSLWPGLDTAIKVDRDADDMYRWRLAERILARLVSEAGADGAQVVIVNIPYLAQVYDEVWSNSFGRREGVYDREIASRRLAEICDRIGAACVDTTSEFQRTAKSRQRWLHWPIDGHPTPEGHELIAKVVAGHLTRHSLLRAPTSAGEPLR